jgi:MOSC domain-containing protein YiiM
MPSVTQILTADSPETAMNTRSEVRAVPGKGLEGDRYFEGTGTFSPLPRKPDFEITFIEGEKIEAFARESGLPFTARHARRNIVTEGVDLNALVGREFSVGDVRI